MRAAAKISSATKGKNTNSQSYGSEHVPEGGVELGATFDCKVGEKDDDDDDDGLQGDDEEDLHRTQNATPIRSSGSDTPPTTAIEIDTAWHELQLTEGDTGASATLEFWLWEG